MKPAFYLTLALVAVTGSASGQEKARTERMSTVPFRTIETGGSLRPMIRASFNKHPLEMMLHSLARFPGGEIQLRHDHARNFGVTGLRQGPKYGIDRPGHASELGSGFGKIATVTVGGTIDRDVSVSVFEIPQTDMGMIGIDWMRRQRIIIDFPAHQATIAPTANYASKAQHRLEVAGYRAIPLTFKDGSYQVRASVNGVVRDMTIGSATHTMVDTALATSAGFERGTNTGTGFGPTGTRVAGGNASAPVVFEIDGWKSPPIVTSVLDIYGYEARERPADPTQGTGGTLGDTFFIKTDAVIDFGSGTLYVRDTKKG